MLNPGWLDAAYMNYAWSDYFRQHQQLQAQQTGGAQPGQTTPTGVGKGNYQRLYLVIKFKVHRQRFDSTFLRGVVSVQHPATCSRANLPIDFGLKTATTLTNRNRTQFPIRAACSHLFPVAAAATRCGDFGVHRLAAPPSVRTKCILTVSAKLSCFNRINGFFFCTGATRPEVANMENLPPPSFF